MGPDFLIIGAQKAGTTSLHAYLGQHPEIFLPVRKEPHFFCAPGDGGPPPWFGPVDLAVRRALVWDPDGYADLFADAAGRTTGEASTMYLVDPAVPGRVVAAIPTVRVIVVLRDPVTRAHAAWWMWRRARLEPLDFAEALAAETRRCADGWGPNYAYRANGRYGEHLTRWRDVLDPAQMLVLLDDDLRHARRRTVQEVFAFLGVDDTFEPDLDRELNVGGGRSDGRRLHPRHLVRAARSRVRRAVPPAWRRSTRPAPLPRRRPPIPPAVAADLRTGYADDVAATEELLGWDLSAWR